MKQLCIFLLFASLLFTLTCRAQKPDLHYTLTKKDSTTLAITVAFTGNSKGNTILHLPNTWASQTDLYKAVSAITALSSGTSITPTPDPDHFAVQYQPRSRVVFSYQLHKDWTGRLRYPLYFRPVITPGFFYFDGYSGLVYPDLADTTNIHCTLAYEGFSKDDFIGNSFFANKKNGQLIVSLSNLLNSIFCAGDFRSKTIKIKGHQIVVALTGKPAFTDKEAFSSISRIILAERRFWNDAGPDYYFTTFLPLYDQGNTGGTAYYHAFSLFQSTDQGLSENLLPMIAHEYFHNWLGLGLKMPEPDEPYKWFSEGFTEYYSYKILWQTGIISKEDFLRKINAYIRNYFLSPYFNLPNRKLIGRYWESSELKLLSYRRGLVLAFLLDNRIMENRHQSLDDLLRSLYVESSPSMTFSNKLFGSLVLSYSDQHTLDAIDQANAGNNGQLAHLLFADPIYRMDTLKVEQMFDLGFDYQASKAAGKVKGLEAGSNAAKAGLTENMQLTDKYSIWFNNTQKPAMVGVIDHGKAKLIEYLPVTKVDRLVPQMENVK